MTSSSLTGIDLFTGAGGLSYGLSQAGFDMKLGIEIDPDSTSTLKENNKEVTVLQKDIKSLDPKKVLKSTGLRKSEIYLIAGGPPCQGFSTSNRRTRSIDNPLNGLYKQYFRFVRAINPEVFLFENVAGLRTLHNGSVLNKIINTGKRLGYHIHWDILNSEEFGVPQRRKRIIIIGTKKKEVDFSNIKKTGTVTVKNAISDLPKIENGNSVCELGYPQVKRLSDYHKRMRAKTNGTVSNNLVTENSSLVLKRYKHIPQGGNWSSIPKRLMKNYYNLNNCHSWIYYRLKWDEPSVVINNFRKNMLIHPTQDRGLSVREAARLQSFPDHYKFYGKIGSQQQQVANAVPPLMAKKIGKNIKLSLGDL